jgi:hypothetical protein
MGRVDGRILQTCQSYSSNLQLIRGVSIPVDHYSGCGGDMPTAASGLESGTLVQRKAADDAGFRCGP